MESGFTTFATGTLFFNGGPTRGLKMMGFFRTFLLVLVAGHDDEEDDIFQSLGTVL